MVGERGFGCAGVLGRPPTPSPRVRISARSVPAPADVRSVTAPIHSVCLLVKAPIYPC